MINNSSIQNLSVWENFVKISKKFCLNIRKILREFSSEYTNTAQIIQLTFIYCFALIDLCHAVLNNVFLLGYFPQFLKPIFPFLQEILLSPIIRAWSSPEKVFFLSYIVIEFMIVRSTFNFSKLVKYNILLVFSVLMVQGLFMSYWDLLFHREISKSVAKWAYDQGAIINTDKRIAIFFFLSTFIIFIGGYLYLYLLALSGKFPKITGMHWLTDSVAFWLRIKTPTMRFGKRKKK